MERRNFSKAYEAVYELRDAAGNQLEDFTGRPHPESGREVMIPTRHEKSKLVVAQIYAKEAVKHFTVNHPLLSKILRVYAEETAKALYKDIEQFFPTQQELARKPIRLWKLSGWQKRNAAKHGGPNSTDHADFPFCTCPGFSSHTGHYIFFVDTFSSC